MNSFSSDIPQVICSVSNGVFGEFLQGVGSDDQPFLITSPVNIYSKACFTFNPTLQHIKIENRDKSKSQQLADKMWEKYRLKKGGVISVETQFPVGKGLGSSSADLVAVAKALSAAYSLNFGPQEIEEIIRGIEPTDGVMYPGVVSYYYKQVKLNKTLGTIKGAVILGVDEGGEIDTVQYNKVKRDFSEYEKQRYDQLHNAIEKAIRNNDIGMLGQISTDSSHLNQRFNHKKLLNEFIEISKSLQLPGIVVAHSGTYIGFLLDSTNPHFQKQVSEVKKATSRLGYRCESFSIQS